MFISFPRAALAALTLGLAACSGLDASDVGSSADSLTVTGAAGVATIGSASYPLAGIDKPRLADELVMYTRTNAQVSCPTNQWGVEVSLVGGRITAVSDRQATNAPPMTIPQGGVVLSGHGAARAWLLANAAVGGSVELSGAAASAAPRSNAVSIGQSSFVLAGTNVPRGVDELVRYTRLSTQLVSPANMWGAEVSVVAGKVVEVRDRQTTGEEGLPIPVGGYVLSGHGAAREWLLANAAASRTVALGQPDGTAAPTTSPSTPPATPPATSGNLPSKVVGGYLTTWEARNGVTLRSLVDNTNYNLIYVAFALGVTASSGALQLDLPPGTSSPADFKSQVAYANSKGKKVIVSVGGYYDLPGQQSGYRLDSSTKVDQFMTSIRGLRDAFGFNGMDWDLEHGERYADKDGIVDASRRMRGEFGPTWIICFAPGINLQTWVGAGGVLDTLGLGGWDAVGEQVYDLGLSESEYATTIVSRMTALANKYGPAKTLLGNKYKNDSGATLADPSNDFVDIATTKGALTTLRAGGRNIRGAFTWTAQSDSDAAFAWQGANGVGGDILSHP